MLTPAAGHAAGSAGYLPFLRDAVERCTAGLGVHCTALHCTATALGASTIQACCQAGAERIPRLSCLLHKTPQSTTAMMHRSVCPAKKKKAMCPNTPCTWPRIATTHTTPIARTGSRTASPSGISRHARTPPRLTLRLTVQSSCPPSPALLPCFHTSTQNRLNCPAAQQLAPSSLRLARASGCMTHVTLEGLVGLVGFFTAGSE